MRKLAAQSSASRHLNKPRIQKHHWFLGSLVILAGSWITHTTTATVYNDFSSQRAMAFAAAVANDEILQNGGMPDELSAQALPSDALGNSQNPASNLFAGKQSPTDQVFESLEDGHYKDPLFEGPLFELPLDETIYTIVRGDTLGGIFKKLKLDLSLPHVIGQHQTGRELVSLTIGKDLVFKTDRGNQLKQIAYPVTALQELVVDLEDGAIVKAEVAALPYQTEQKSVSSEISSSLYESALEAGLSNAMVMEMVRIFGWDIDFVLDIRQGDNFHVIYEEHLLNGRKLSDGNILAAEFTTQNQTYRAIRFEDGEDGVSYYNQQGESMLGTFLRSPVEFSRISSRFGKRKHPILKTWRAHKGVDYAASRGTPIRATADGKVIHAGKKGGYGNTVVLRHAGRFSTLYGHMNGYAKGLRSGNRVKQGDVIGYIGSTGLATGPHLHYEFRLDGVHRNPLTYKTPKASAVSAAKRPEFDQLTNRWMAQLNSITGAYRLARNHHSQPNNGAKPDSLTF